MQCTIHMWGPSDAADLATAMNSPSILKNLRDGIPYSCTRADAEEYIRTMLDAEPGSQYAFAIDMDGRAIDSIGAFRQADIHFRIAEPGYYVAKPYWGQDTCASTVRQTCGYVFQNGDILRVFAKPFAHNTASCRVLEKAGPILEGTLRKNVFKNGEVLDMKLYSLIE